MATVAIAPTGVLQIDGTDVFPIGFSNPPPLGKKAPSGLDGLKELKAGGASFIRTGRADWSIDSSTLGTQIKQERDLEDAAQAVGLHCWLWLGDTPNLPTTPGSDNEKLLTRITAEFKGHPALGAYKGYDEPRNPFSGNNFIRPAGLKRAKAKLAELDPDHPVVIIQAPPSPVEDLIPYRGSFDITGADIFPVSYPPGRHAVGPAGPVAGQNRDISLVGDITKKMVQAAGGAPVWTTLQIAWKWATTAESRKNVVPRFPTLFEERFMAYQAIVNGARGLMFFGGHLTHNTRPRDAEAGWNWRFWELVLRPLLQELTSTAVNPILVAPDSAATVTASAADVELTTRQDDQFVYVIAVRRGAATTMGSPTNQVKFSGLPSKQDGSPITDCQVLFEYAQDPLPPPLGPPAQQVFRSVSVTNAGFSDWFGPHDVHVYRFSL
jgi:hypothetical protein